MDQKLQCTLLKIQVHEIEYMEIKINGLTDIQKSIADIIWACDSQDEVELFIQGLPANLKKDGRTVFELMKLAVWDNVNDIEDKTTNAINKLKGK